MYTAEQVKQMELPPRARRIPPLTVPIPWIDGTTSACAENTRLSARNRPATRNYLRVRGEYLTRWFIFSSRVELPPRARRIPDSL